jgi:prepilin-type N-terminal cleavage/methylation domain-containing protein
MNSMSSSQPQNSDNRGFSLVEVLIAMAILSTVLIGIMTLFVLARKNVYSGKQMTQAASAGTRVLEELNSLNKSSTLAAFGLGTATTGTANTINGESFPNSFVRTTTNITTATDPNGFLARWRAEILNTQKLKDGAVTIVFTPKADSGSPPANPVPMTTATILQMRIFINWNETGRDRQIVLDNIKVERN